MWLGFWVGDLDLVAVYPITVSLSYSVPMLKGSILSISLRWYNSCFCCELGVGHPPAASPALIDILLAPSEFGLLKQEITCITRGWTRRSRIAKAGWRVCLSTLHSTSLPYSSVVCKRCRCLFPPCWLRGSFQQWCGIAESRWHLSRWVWVWVKGV